jgi:nitrate reductase NapAB chaperone NapD
VVVASWIVTVAPDRAAAARAGIGALPGARVGAPPAGRVGERPDDAGDGLLVVSTECADGGMGRVQERLAAVPGVVSVAMVVAYREAETEVPR